MQLSCHNLSSGKKDKTSVPLCSARGATTLVLSPTPSPIPSLPSLVLPQISLLHQVGPINLKESAIISVFQKMMWDKAFAQLRTVEQLGYIAGSTTSERSGSMGFVILVQSAIKVKKKKFCLLLLTLFIKITISPVFFYPTFFFSDTFSPKHFLLTFPIGTHLPRHKNWPFSFYKLEDRPPFNDKRNSEWLHRWSGHGHCN